MLQLPWVRTGKLEYEPGAKTSYSSTNFVLLGLLLAEAANATDWSSFDQGTFIPEAVRARLSGRVRWATRGAPVDYGITPGFDRTNYNGQHPSSGGVDVSLVHGVFAGWSASDFVGTTADVAELGHALYGPRYEIVSKRYVDQMVPTAPFYGFATFNLTFMEGQQGAYAHSYGHLGATYGYQSSFTYEPKLDLAFAIASDIETDDQAQPVAAYCQLFNRVKNWMLKEPVSKCQFVKQGYYGGFCSCSLAASQETIVV